MHLCYVDESGKAEVLTKADSDQQPVVVIGGVLLPETNLRQVTHDWIALKAAFYPEIRKAASQGWLDAILHDLKGTKVRHGFKSGAARRKGKHSIGLVDGTLKLLEQHGGQLVARIWVKALDEANDAMPLYQSSLQFICSAFNSQIPKDERGLVIVDSQTYWHNHLLAHSVFTQRFGRKARHEKLADMPVFGHSDNHAGLQIADFLCSAVLAPIACGVYAGTYSHWNTHCDSGYLDIRDRFGTRLEALTFTWENKQLGRESSSVVVKDPVGRRSSALMWSPVSSGPAKKSNASTRRRRRRQPRARRAGT